MRKSKDVESHVSEVLALPKETRSEFIEHMRSEYASSGKHHYCDTLGCNVVDACRLSSCPFHFASSDNLNCLIQYRSELGGALKPSDLSGIIGKSDREVKKKIEHVFNKIRREMLRRALDVEPVNRFDYVSGAHVCVNCACLCNKKQHKSEHHDLYWCSRSCKLAKPQWVLDLEVRYRTDAKVVLYHGLKLFKSIAMLASVFHVRKTSLLDVYYEHFGIKPSQFGLEVVDNVDLLRNPKSNWEPEMLLHKQSEESRFTRLEKRFDKLVKTL